MSEGRIDFRESEQGRAASQPRPWLRMATSERLVTLVRRGHQDAFEVLYDRHAGELLGYCRSILRCQQDAEDALQSTFVAAYRSLAADSRELAVRPWLFAIARNTCLSILRQRRLDPPLGEPAAPAVDPLESIERDEELRELLQGVRGLPERQRSAIVLAELHGLSHREIASVLEVEPAQVKSYVFQARAKLAAEREARGADCLEIRSQLDDARGPALLRTRLRHHLVSCEPCREYARALAHRRSQGLGAWAPLAPLLALRRRALSWWPWGDPSPTAGAAECAGAGASLAAGVEVVGGGTKLLLGKLAAGLALVGAGAVAGTGIGIGVPAPAFLAGAAPSRPSGAVAVADAGAVPPASAEGSAVALGAAGTLPRNRVGGGQKGSAPSPRPARLGSEQGTGDRGGASAPVTGTVASEVDPGRGGGGQEGATGGGRGEAPGRAPGAGNAPPAPGQGGDGQEGATGGGRGEAPGRAPGAGQGGGGQEGATGGGRGEAPERPPGTGNAPSGQGAGSGAGDAPSGQGGGPAGNAPRQGAIEHGSEPSGRAPGTAPPPAGHGRSESEQAGGRPGEAGSPGGRQSGGPAPAGGERQGGGEPAPGGEHGPAGGEHGRH